MFEISAAEVQQAFEAAKNMNAVVKKFLKNDIGNEPKNLKFIKALKPIALSKDSNAKLDFEVPLALDGTGAQCIPTGKLQGGLWKVRVQWTSGGQEFFHDQSVVL